MKKILFGLVISISLMTLFTGCIKSNKTIIRYQKMEENVQELLDAVSSLQDQVKDLKSKNLELEGRKMVFDLSNTTSYSSVDVLKRISRLEEYIYNK